MKPMATRNSRPAPIYTRVNDSWHILRVNGLAFFGRTTSEVLKKERAWWRTQRRAAEHAAIRTMRHAHYE